MTDLTLSGRQRPAKTGRARRFFRWLASDLRAAYRAYTRGLGG